MNTRRFQCPFCDYVKNFYGKEAKKFRKRVAGFTCPKCGKKVTEDDIARKKGKGPRPPEERRKRVRKEVVKETFKAIVQPYVEQFKWRTSEPPPPGEGGRSKPTQPIDMSFAETVLSGRGVRVSAPIPPDSFSMEEKEELEPSRADPGANREKKMSKEMKSVVVVDDNNYWLFYGDVESREEAIEQAKECDAFDPDAEIYVYEVKGELK